MWTFSGAAYHSKFLPSQSLAEQRSAGGLWLELCGVPGVGEVVADSISLRFIDEGVRVVSWAHFVATASRTGTEISSETTQEELTQVARAGSVDFLLSGSVAASQGGSAFLYGGIGSAAARTTVTGASAQLVDVRTGEVAAAVSYVPETIYDVPAKIGERIAKGIIKKLR